MSIKKYFLMNCLRYILFVTIITVLFGMSGCQSPQEKTGFSKIPQNSPAKWETNSAPGVSF